MITNVKFENVHPEVRDILKLDLANSLLKLDNLKNLPDKKFDRVLYSVQHNEQEQDTLPLLIERCNRKGLVFVRNIPEINKWLSNGVLVKNRELLTEQLQNNGITQYWILSSRKDDCFDLLLETK